MLTTKSIVRLEHKMARLQGLNAMNRFIRNISKIDEMPQYGCMFNVVGTSENCEIELISNEIEEDIVEKFTKYAEQKIKDCVSQKLDHLRYLNTLHGKYKPGEIDLESSYFTIKIDIS